MLEEAVAVMRMLWTGDDVTHYGKHYTVENARIFSLPPEPPPVVVSGFGPKAIEMAARIGDGYVSTKPDADLVKYYVDCGGKGPKMAGTKVCWGDDAESSRKLAHHLWRSSGLPGELAQELPTPAHFAQAAELVTEEASGKSTPCGPDPEVHAQSIRQYIDAGYDEIYIHQIGPDQDGFLRFFRDEVEPLLHS